jgi:hypothetical protein
VRKLDCARKRKQRERERQRALETTAEGFGPQMSRACLGAPARAAIDEALEKLGQDQRMSRACLRRRLTRIALVEEARLAAVPGT